MTSRSALEVVIANTLTRFEVEAFVAEDVLGGLEQVSDEWVGNGVVRRWVCCELK